MPFQMFCTVVLIVWHRLEIVARNPFHAVVTALPMAVMVDDRNVLIAFQIACTAVLIALHTVLIIVSRPFHSACKKLTMADMTPLINVWMPFQMPEIASDSADRMLEISLFSASKSPVTKSQIIRTTPSTAVLMASQMLVKICWMPSKVVVTPSLTMSHAF